jgi:hypothetical protein
MRSSLICDHSGSSRTHPAGPRPVQFPRFGHLRAGGTRSSPVLATSRIRENSRPRAGSCGPSILVMQATEQGEGDDVPLSGALRGDGRLLVDPLVRAGSVVVAEVLGDDALEVPGVEYENVVEAFATQRAEEALTHGVHFRRAHGRSDRPAAGGARERKDAA